MSNKLIKDKPVKQKENKFIKHMLATHGGSGRDMPNWYCYLVLIVAIYALVTNTNW